MGERAGVLANWTTVSKESHVKLDEMFVQGDELLFKSLFLKDNTTLNAIVTLSLFYFTMFFNPSFLGGFSHYIVSFYTILIVHYYRWKFLKGHLSRLVTCLTNVRPIREG